MVLSYKNFSKGVNGSRLYTIVPYRSIELLIGYGKKSIIWDWGDTKRKRQTYV